MSAIRGLVYAAPLGAFCWVVIFGLGWCVAKILGVM